MIKNICFIVMSCILTFVCHSQESSFTSKLSTDSLLIGNRVMVSFELHNLEGEFTPPSFDHMEVQSGPNISSSYSMINGQTTQLKTYSYILLPQKEGSHYIEPATLETSEGIFETEILALEVYPNPENIIEELQVEPFSQSFQFNFDPFDGQLEWPEMKTPEKSKKLKSGRKLQKI